jgi:hypothetical protein
LAPRQPRTSVAEAGAGERRARDAQHRHPVGNRQPARQPARCAELPLPLVAGADAPRAEGRGEPPHAGQNPHPRSPGRAIGGNPRPGHPTPSPHRQRHPRLRHNSCRRCGSRGRLGPWRVLGQFSYLHAVRPGSRRPPAPLIRAPCARRGRSAFGATRRTDDAHLRCWRAGPGVRARQARGGRTTGNCRCRGVTRPCGGARRGARRVRPLVGYGRRHRQVRYVARPGGLPGCPYGCGAGSAVGAGGGHSGTSTYRPAPSGAPVGTMPVRWPSSDTSRTTGHGVVGHWSTTSDGDVPSRSIQTWTREQLAWAGAAPAKGNPRPTAARNIPAGMRRFFMA